MAQLYGVFIIPVSYTHLDVYKRQLQHGVAPYILERRTGSRGAGEQGSRGGRKRRQILPRSPTPLLPCASQFITPHENNPLVLIANPQLLLGAEHRVIVDAAQRAALELGLDAVSYTRLDVYKRQTCDCRA